MNDSVSYTKMKSLFEQLRMVDIIDQYEELTKQATQSLSLDDFALWLAGIHSLAVVSVILLLIILIASVVITRRNHKTGSLAYELFMNIYFNIFFFFAFVLLVSSIFSLGVKRAEKYGKESKQEFVKRGCSLNEDGESLCHKIEENGVEIYREKVIVRDGE